VESPFTNRVISPLATSCELLPEEYYVSRRIRGDGEKLPSIDPELRYTPTDKLFLFFYLAVGEMLQLKAANQLFKRGWRYIKTSGIWIARIKDRQLDHRSLTHERGTYQYFNVQTWKREHGSFSLLYEDLAEDPNIRDVQQHSAMDEARSKEKALNYLIGERQMSNRGTTPNCMTNYNDQSSLPIGSPTYSSRYGATYAQSNQQQISTFVNTAQTSSKRTMLKGPLQEAMLKMLTSQYLNSSNTKPSQVNMQ
jgi:hypothetical protein